MKAGTVLGRTAKPATTLLIAVSCLALAGFGTAEKAKPGDGAVPLTVPKAVCGPGDHPASHPARTEQTDPASP